MCLKELTSKYIFRAFLSYFRFKDYASTNPDDQFKYSYNPCEPFSESAPGAWQDHCYAVAVGTYQYIDINIYMTIGLSYSYH